MTRSLRDALGEAYYRVVSPRVAERWPWTEAHPDDAEECRDDADKLIAIAGLLGITITMGGAPENTER